MADVFLSYARQDEPHARRAAEALRAEGRDVWLDEQLPVHRSYSEVIEEHLSQAKAVLVLWSAAAAASEWVRAEADTGRNSKKLVQASLDGGLPPIPFNQVQCADLSGWTGAGGHPGWQKVLESVDALAPAPRIPVAIDRSHAVPDRVSVCVLPFQNMSGDIEQDYFSDGISEDITTDLSKVSALAVTARNTAFTFKGRSVDIVDVARRLGVSHVLEGSVRKAGGRVRITAQLVDGQSGDHVWAERFDRDLTDIFAIQDEISEAIVAALKLRLLPAEKKAIETRATASAEAYNFYLMARKFWVAGNYGDRKREQRVVRLARRAVEIDPDYADAWALMALAQVSLYFYFGDLTDDGEAAADRALQINPSIAEAYAVKARIHKERREIDAANRDIALALRLGPESWEVHREAARVAMGQRHVEEAAHHFEKAVALIESDFHSWAMLVMCYQAQGRRDDVRRGARMMHTQADKVLAEDPSNGAALGICAGGHAIAGNRERAMETIERALLIDPDNINMRYNFGCVLAGYLGEVDAALDLLGPVLGEGGHTLINTATTDPDLDSLRSDPRFQAMLDAALARIGTQPRDA